MHGIKNGANATRREKCIFVWQAACGRITGLGHGEVCGDWVCDAGRVAAATRDRPETRKPKAGKMNKKRKGFVHAVSQAVTTGAETDTLVTVSKQSQNRN